MNPTATALRAGWSRGLIELRQSFANGAELGGHFFWPMLMVIATFFLRDVSFGSSGFLLGTLVLPSILGMNVGLGMISMSQQLTAEREDGTLLRAKATPNGMLGYLVGKIVMFALSTLLKLVVILVSGIMLVSNVILDARACLLLTLIFVVGMVATVPIGVALGSVMKSSLQALLVPLTCAL